MGEQIVRANQLAACQRAAEDNPLWPPARLGVAQALASLQRDQAADEELDRIKREFDRLRQRDSATKSKEAAR